MHHFGGMMDDFTGISAAATPSRTVAASDTLWGSAEENLLRQLIELWIASKKESYGSQKFKHA